MKRQQKKLSLLLIRETASLTENCAVLNRRLIFFHYKIFYIENVSLGLRGSIVGRGTTLQA
jgi:hypothetical protein